MWADLQDLWRALLLQYITKVKDPTWMGTGDSRHDTFPPQSHLQGHCLSVYIQPLTVLENKSQALLPYSLVFFLSER